MPAGWWRGPMATGGDAEGAGGGRHLVHGVGVGGSRPGPAAHLFGRRGRGRRGRADRVHVVSGAAPDSTFTFGRDHWRTEEHIRNTGIRHTILRDSINLDFLPLLAGPEGVIRGPAGDGRVGAGARDDIADAGVAVLLGDGHDGRTYDLTGRRPWSATLWPPWPDTRRSAWPSTCAAPGSSDISGLNGSRWLVSFAGVRVRGVVVYG
jgi:uncharacterized protein YbjT (DUF2867 family)